mmetsp:Transcript_10740/g.9283  ORF Transcript_10740/g.9283 Transcript_10740/m.9283 type:complete len:244 (+) Transcript_10740:478-1209(+)
MMLWVGIVGVVLVHKMVYVLLLLAIVVAIGLKGIVVLDWHLVIIVVSSIHVEEVHDRGSTLLLEVVVVSHLGHGLIVKLSISHCVATILRHLSVELGGGGLEHISIVVFIEGVEDAACGLVVCGVGGAIVIAHRLGASLALEGRAFVDAALFILWSGDITVDSENVGTQVCVGDFAHLLLQVELICGFGGGWGFGLHRSAQRALLVPLYLEDCLVSDIGLEFRLCLLFLHIKGGLSINIGDTS